MWRQQCIFSVRPTDVEKFQRLVSIINKNGYWCSINYMNAKLISHNSQFPAIYATSFSPCKNVKEDSTVL